MVASRRRDEASERESRLAISWAAMLKIDCAREEFEYQRERETGRTDERIVPVFFGGR